MTLAASAAASLAPAGAFGQSTKGEAAKPSRESVSQIIEGWPKTAKFAAKTMIEKYGPRAEATPTRLIWFNNGPWKRTIVDREEVDHDFPMPHKNVMEQYVDYKVPPDKADELARYDVEAANFVALNLAHAEKLQFGPQRNTAFRDETTVPKDMVKQAEKFKQAITKEKEGAATGGTK